MDQAFQAEARELDEMKHREQRDKVLAECFRRPYSYKGEFGAGSYAQVRAAPHAACMP
jgi:hypothetical protein